ncbi:MAG: antitoxin [Candidatus Margulisbacteria bacterium]|nr:antitoxin [Candidatus Margulisiibacteriota bacterium]
MKKDKKNEYEKEILDSFNNGEWESVQNLKSELKKHSVYAKNTMKKDKRVNIRISFQDLEGVQLKAMEEGMPYQTLLTSIIHKYITGRYIEKGR